jgi:hypothetical protein
MKKKIDLKNADDDDDGNYENKPRLLYFMRVCFELKIIVILKFLFIF